MHTSQLKPTAQLVVQVYNEIFDLALIQQALDCSYLAEKTGYEGTLGKNDRVCFSCYKSHLHYIETHSEFEY